MYLKGMSFTIPFLDNFWKWAKWGEKLMSIHMNFCEAEGHKLKKTEKGKEEEVHDATILKADKTKNKIILDGQTILSHVPKNAWDYKIGNRSAIEWVLDQYKEKTPKESVVREKFGKYKFKDYKEQVIELIQRIVTVSTDTLKITEAMNDNK